MLVNQFTHLIHSYYQFYASGYSELAENQTPLQAISILSQNRVELERVCNQVAKKLRSTLDKSLKEEYLNDYSNLLEEVLINVRLTEGNLPSLGQIINNQMRFQTYMESYLLEKYQTEAVLESIYQQTEKYYDSIYRLDAIVLVISKVIENNYTKDLLHELSEKEIEEQQKESRPGPKLDPAIDQDLLTSRIKELVKKGKANEPRYGKFWHHDDRYGRKGKPKINQLIKQMFKDGLDGGMDEQTVENRIKRALDTLGINY